MGIRVGIDLGTTFSAVARINESTGRPEVIKNSLGSPITPSVLSFRPDGTVLFGQEAKDEQQCGDVNSIGFFKRSMGHDNFRVEFFGKEYSAEDLSAILLRKLVEEAEASCGEKIDSAVITVPAYFTHKERQATMRAGERAGLKILSIINEPTAAAFAYGLNEKEGEQTVLIYDLGGGTFDVTIARINKDEIQILASDGNHELGGKDWDDCIARFISSEFEEEYGVDITDDENTLSSLVVTSEEVKKKLTSMDVVKVPIASQGVKGTITITEQEFEDISRYLIGATKDLTNNLIESIGLTWKDITGVILVGGSTRMRMIHNYVTEMSGKEPLAGVNVDEAVALGAAIKANIDKSGRAAGKGKLSMAGDDMPQFVLGGKKVTDVTAHALGMIAVSEDGERYINSVIIPKNSPIPTEEKRSYKFRTRAKDNEMEVYVLQGAYERPLDNVILDKYTITGIKNVVQNPSVIEVSYRYTENGVVEVGAVQTETGKNLPIRIEKVPDDMSWTDGSPNDHDQTPARKPETDIMLCIDLSGSMYGEPTEKAKEAMTQFVDQLDPEYCKIGIISFADKSRLNLPLTNDFQKVKLKISQIRMGIGLKIKGDYYPAGIAEWNVGNGNEAEPFTEARGALRPRRNEERLLYIVVLTDGQWYNIREAVSRAQKCKDQNIEIMALGFGEADYKFLRRIASVEEFATLTDLNGLSRSFSKIAQTIGEGASGSGLTLKGGR